METYSQEQIRRVLNLLGIKSREEFHRRFDKDVTPESVHGLMGIGDVRDDIIPWLRGLSDGDWVTYVGPLEQDGGDALPLPGDMGDGWPE